MRKSRRAQEKATLYHSTALIAAHKYEIVFDHSKECYVSRSTNHYVVTMNA